jgi:hypothetical protein
MPIAMESETWKNTYSEKKKFNLQHRISKNTKLEKLTSQNRQSTLELQRLGGGARGGGYGPPRHSVIKKKLSSSLKA